MKPYTVPMFDVPTLGEQPLELRPYQRRGANEIAREHRAGKRRVMLAAPTGAGKTTLAAYVIQRVRARDMKVAFLADTLNLVDQASRRFASYGIEHGLAQSENTRGRSLPVQVCSMQTVEKRGFLQKVDVLILDEAHLLRQWVTDFIERHPGLLVIGLSATPLTPGLGLHYDSLVNLCTTDYLLRTNDPATGKPYLAPLVIFSGVEADMRGAQTGVGGEWRSAEVRERSRPIIGDIVSSWGSYTKKFFGGPVRTLLFSADIAHGEELCAAFQRAGFDFRQSTYRDSFDDTREIVASHRRDDFVGLVSVDRFAKGHDDPGIQCIVDARPNRTLAPLAQKVGRGMRSAPGKTMCLYLDHAGNFHSLYDDVLGLWAHGVEELDSGEKRRSLRSADEERAEVKCSCSLIFLPGMEECPACGRERPKRKTKARMVPGRLADIKVLKPAPWMLDRDWVWKQLCALALKNKKGDEKKARGTASGYWLGLYGHWPRGREFAPAKGVVDKRVEGRVKYNQIRFFYSQKKKKGSGA